MLRRLGYVWMCVLALYGNALAQDVDICPVMNHSIYPGLVSSCPGGVSGNSSSSSLVAPATFVATDGTTQAKVESTTSATDYPDFTAGLTGVGASYGVGSSNTNAPVNFAAKGTGAVNLGNGSYVTPILAAASTQSGYPTYPTFIRFLNASGIVSASLSVPATGSFVLRPDAGINSYGARAGQSAIDMQICSPFDDASPYRIASGLGSFAGGCNNISSANYTVAMGQFNNATATSAVAIGNSTIANGLHGNASGRQSSDLGHFATAVWSSGQKSAAGDAQYRRMMGRCTSAGTAGSTCRLTADAGAASSTNTFNIGNASSTRMMALRCTVAAKVNGTTGSQGWILNGILQRAANTTTYNGDAAGTSIGTLGTVNTISIAASADDTNEGLNLTFTDTTGIGGTGFSVTAICDGVETAG